MIRKTLIFVCCAFALGCFSQSASAAQDNNIGNDGQPIGKVWQGGHAQPGAMQLKIDKVVGQVDSLEDRVAASEKAINTLQAENIYLKDLMGQNTRNISTLQKKIQDNSILIGKLKDQVAEIREALSS